ncbi:MAG: N-acetylmuramoyl-L-alanine amidase [bacterium]
MTRSLFHIALLALGLFGLEVGAATQPCINIVYPEPEQRIGAVDSTFVFGNVPQRVGRWAYQVTVNGHHVEVHDDGGFLAFVPIEPGEFVFRVQATLTADGSVNYQGKIKAGHEPQRPEYQDQLVDSVIVFVPRPWQALGADSLVIVGDYHPPSGDLSVEPGHLLQVRFRGTPGCRAWFGIDGVADSVPMSEDEPLEQPYWGEAVFGGGAVPDSLKVRGIYSGMLAIPEGVRVDTARIKYYLASPSLAQIFLRLFGPVQDEHLNFDLAGYLRLARLDTLITRDARWRLSVGGRDYPRTVRFTDSVQIVRHGPRQGYLSIFQPEGVEALAVGGEGAWLNIRLSESVDGWVHRESVELLPIGIMPPHSRLRSIRTHSGPEGLDITLLLSGRHPFRVEESDRRHIVLSLYGVTSDTDWIRYDFSDSLLDFATWRQPEPGLYELHLNLKIDAWGFDTYYDGTTLHLLIARPPERVGKLEGKIIVIDPGHSADPGARGPTGLTEAQANLDIALALRDRLQKRGATVVMTRDDLSNVPLYDRPAIAKQASADLFISIHNNALPDGVNPFENNGTSTYYYHPHSIDLAKAVHPRLAKATGLSDHGLFYGNLAVVRPTQYPAILVECAFMMIPQQEARLKSDKFQDQIAKGIVRGIEDFLREYEHRQRHN